MSCRCGRQFCYTCGTYNATCGCYSDVDFPPVRRREVVRRQAVRGAELRPNIPLRRANPRRATFKRRARA